MSIQQCDIPGCWCEGRRQLLMPDLSEYLLVARSGPQIATQPQPVAPEPDYTLTHDHCWTEGDE